jgi:hypothetical protein
MADPIEGRFGALICVPWIRNAPNGQDAAYLLLATSDERAQATMPGVAEALGLDPRPAAFTSRAVTRARVYIGDDDWIFLVDLSGQLVACRAASAEWASLAHQEEQVVLAIGYLPMPAEMHVDTYMEWVRESLQLVVGLVALA